MSESTYDVFRSVASLGMEATLYLTIDGKLTSKRGVIRKITPSGVLLQNSHETSFVSGEAVQNFTIARPPEHDQQSPALPNGDDASEQEKEAPLEYPDADPVLSDEHFKIFFEIAQLQPPKPDFNLGGLSSDDHTDLVRWKNRYDYAIKISEVNRLVDDVRPIGRLAERLRNADLYFLSGAIAVATGKYDLALPQFVNALALDSIRAGEGLTWLAHRDGDFAKAVEIACRTVTVDANAFGGPESSIATIGRLLGKLSDRDRPGLASAIAAYIGSPSENIANTLLAFALQKTNPVAAKAALTGGLKEVKRLAGETKLLQALPKLSIAPEKTEIVTSPPTQNRVEEFGRITSVYPDKSFGFLTNEVTGQTLYFNFTHVTDVSLLEDFDSGLVGHKVHFVVFPGIKSPRSRYDQARSIKPRPGQAPQLRPFHPPVRPASTKLMRDGSRAPLPTRLAVLPKGAGPYAEAKRYEQLDNLDAAEELFRRAITEGDDYRQSAIKDLSMLLSRKNRPIEGIQLLDQYRDEFEPKRPVDNLKAVLLIKANRHREAANLFVSLYKSSPIGTKESITSARQAGYCFSMVSDFTNALRYLEEVDKVSRGDTTTIKLIEKVRAAQAAGTLSSDVATQLQELAGVAAASGLSSFAAFFLQMSDYKGADERSITRGFFDHRDFQHIDRQMRAVRGRQPRMKGQLLQTLAAMCVKAPLEAGDLSVQDVLRSCFLFMGEAAINDKLAVDSVRCFLAEAAHLAMRSDQVTDVARYLLSTYLSEPLSAEKLTEMGGSKPIAIQHVIQLFEDDQTGWAGLVDDFPYYTAVAESAATLIEHEARRNSALSASFPAKSQVEHQRIGEVARISSELTVLRSLLSHPVTGAGLQQISQSLRECAPTTRFKLDQERLSELARLTADASVYWTEQDFIEREAVYGRVTGGLKTLSDSIKREPTRLTIDPVLPLVDRLLTELIDDFDNFRSGASAALSLSNLLQDDYYIPDHEGVITLALEMNSERGSTPIEGIALTTTTDEDRNIQVESCHSPELLRGGTRREVQIKIKPTSAQLAEQAFTIQVLAKYHNRAAAKIEERLFSLPIGIGKADSFGEISNPYAAYSGGAIVSDPRMLFGRSNLLGRIQKQVVDGPVGQCFVLYGQKRSGKSSILHRLKELLIRPRLGVLITIGTMDVNQAEVNFVRLCIDSIEERLSDGLGIGSCTRPSNEELASSPLRSFQNFVKNVLTCLEKSGWDSPRLVLLIDEFTYLFEYIQEGIISKSFMRQWKGFLELGMFSAVVVGQDSMPKFKQAFPNEFGVTHDERISYLSQPDAIDLAQTPIATGGGSRYRGRAMDRLLHHTAGNPFYLQIMCDHLVRHLNRRRRPFVTEADVDQVGSSTFQMELTSLGSGAPTR